MNSPSQSSLSSSSSSSSRVSMTRLYSIATLFALSLLQLVPQFSVMESIRNMSRDDERVTHNNSSSSSGIAAQPSDNPSATAVPFDYASFWEDSLAAARKSLDSERNASGAKQQQEPCPKVYVYDLPSSLVDQGKKGQAGFGKEVSLKGSADKEFQGYLFHTNQYAFPTILEQRLRASKLCRTTNPSEADLFYAPVLPAPKMVKHWNATCQEVSGEMVRDALPHLNASNACRHVFAIGKGHYIGEPCRGWYSHPIRELKPFQRLAYSDYKYVFDDSNKGAHEYDPHDATRQDYPNLHSVPYPSSLHFRKSSTDMPQFRKMQKRRKVLMSFIGKDTHGDVPVRSQIRKLCTSNTYGSKICDYVESFRPAMATLKSKATFCLEPAGDSPWRKSISDSIVFGCIPVLFSEMTDNVTPWFWNDWKDRGRILVPREDFVAGRIDLKRLLQSIPPQLLELMQSTLREKARQFQYSLDDDQHDGIRLALDNLHREAVAMEQKGICGY